MAKATIGLQDWFVLHIHPHNCYYVFVLYINYQYYTVISCILTYTGGRSESPNYICLITGLRVRNSLTETLEEFIPSEGKLVRWYICGPTVYDSSHLGHARSEVTSSFLQFAANLTD